MKRFLFVFAVLALSIALVACGGNGTDTTVDDGTTPPVVDEATEHVHNFVDEIIPATCTTKGSVIGKCECGAEGTATEIPLADHIASTLDCEKDTVCTVCNAVLAEKAGHNFSNIEVVTEATCTSTGKQKGVCLVCGKIVESEIPTAAHSIDASAGLTLVDGKYGAKCVTCNSNVSLGGEDVLINLDFEGDMAAELAKYPAFEANAEAINIVDDLDGDKAYLAKSGSILYLGIADRAALAKTGYYELSFDYAQTAKTSKSEASILTFMPGQYAATKVGSLKYGWFFKYNTPLARMEMVLAGSDASVLNDTNSFVVESNKTYKINILCSVKGDAYYVFVDGKYIGVAPLNNVVVDFTDAKNEKSVSIRFGDSAVPGPVFDNFKIQTIK